MALIVYSGGLDSTVLLHLLKSKNEATEALIVDYGQKHKKEIDFAIKNCQNLNVPYNVADLSTITHLFGNSSLTNKNEEIPTGNYNDSNMKSTVVPNRNMIMISVATARAIAIGTNVVAYAAHSGDHAIYPDCRNEFTNALDSVLRVCHYDEITLYRPFIDLNKSQIVKLGAELGVDFKQTWSCYKGEDLHCGKCGTCMERRQAFQEANIPDPTIYQQ
ncbi:MAG: 7-cyano-7-deazaguanine synthase QueC [Verrucomicrobiaceae bacterium]|nr:7-cyano-7-deazaguanine synthase QueC [Verrucomicrobiaceae bacterium]